MAAEKYSIVKTEPSLLSIKQGKKLKLAHKG